jgi:DNA-binding IclR family transcriptional regulator
MSPTRKAAPAGTQVVVRAVRMLKLFTPERPEWQPAELGEELGLTKTTTHRLLGALESEGLVARQPPGTAYRLGPAAIALGAQALRSGDLRSRVRPLLRELAAETGETASLEVLVDREVLILDEAAGPHLVGATAESGTRWPVHATSTGKALLAAMPPEVRRALLGEGPLRRFTKATITDPADLERELRQVAERGWASAVEELEAGYVAVGAVLLDPWGEVVGALSLGGPAQRIDAKRLAVLGERLCAAVGL